jgi:hypothetical protein
MAHSELSSSNYASRRKELLSHVKQLRAIGFAISRFYSLAGIFIYDILGHRLTLTYRVLPSSEIKVQVCVADSAYHVVSLIILIFYAREIKRRRGNFRSTRACTNVHFTCFNFVHADNCPSRCRNLHALPNGMSLVVFGWTMVLSSIYQMGT